MSIVSTNNKIHIKIFVYIGGKIQSIGRVNVSNLCLLLKYLYTVYV